MNIMIKVAVAVLALAWHGDMAGGQGTPAAHCTGPTPVEHEACLTAELTREERALDRMTVRMRRQVPAPARPSLDSAAVAWTRYREIQCMSVYTSISGGSLAGSSLLLCKLSLTKDRRRELATMYALR